MACSYKWTFKKREYLRRTPHPVMVTIRDNRDYTVGSYYPYNTTITGRGVLLKHTILLAVPNYWVLSTKKQSDVTWSSEPETACYLVILGP